MLARKKGLELLEMTLVLDWDGGDGYLRGANVVACARDDVAMLP
jgi:hypothetical protein